MKPRCWIGCVARVIRAELPENVGRICTVIDQAPNGRWIVQFRAPIPWLFPLGQFQQHRIVYDDTGPADDATLMPLIPPPDVKPTDACTPEPLEA